MRENLFFDHWPTSLEKTLHPKEMLKREAEYLLGKSIRPSIVASLLASLEMVSPPIASANMAITTI